MLNFVYVFFENIINRSMNLRILIYIIVLQLFIVNDLCAQAERKGIHWEQSIEFPKEDFTLKSFYQNDDIIDLQEDPEKLKKIVFGFLPYWEYSRGANNNMRYQLLSHIALFDFSLDASGNLENPSGWPWVDVINAAHAAGTKAVIAITNFGLDDNQMQLLFSDSAIKYNLFNSIEQIVTDNKIDGVNIDFEGLKSNIRGESLNNFMLELRNYIDAEIPGTELSFDGPSVDWGGWDLNGLTAIVDHIFIMAYNYHGSWSSSTGPVSPLYSPNNKISVSRSLEEDYKIPIQNFSSKIVLGLPYYGKKWKTYTNYPYTNVKDYIGSTFYKNDIISMAVHGRRWENTSKTPWYSWQSGDWYQVWTEDEESLAYKYDLAFEKDLGGIGIWALNYDAGRDELWDLIERKFSNELSIETAGKGYSISVFPNPTSGKIDVISDDAIIKRISVNNILFENICDYPTSHSIDLSSLKSGLYFIKVELENGKCFIYKVVKL